MPGFSTPAIILRRIDHGDYDLIIKLITLTRGKITVIAKYAKKSTKRFAGVLELFSAIHIVCSSGKGRGLPVLQEASLQNAFSNIGPDIRKTAYASYWAELIHGWLEEGVKQEGMYNLLHTMLSSLDSGMISNEALSILFQMRFLSISGFSPNLSHCSKCRTEVEKIESKRMMFELAKGGIICEKCASILSAGSSRRLSFSKGTIKQLQWAGSDDFEKAKRIRFTPGALKEGLEFLEAFVPYHLGKEPRSLRFLKNIRK